MDKRRYSSANSTLRRTTGDGGIARRMLEKISNIAGECGLDYIWLTVNKHNDTSIRIYKRLGFRIVEELVTDIGSGFVMDDYKMRLDIGE